VARRYHVIATTPPRAAEAYAQAVGGRFELAAYNGCLAGFLEK
jgi:hypothetical protein